MYKEGASWKPTVTDQGIYGFFGEFRWLSNFHMSTVLHEGIYYPSVEHAYQAAKTEDIEVRMLFLQLPKPNQAKRFGQALELRKDWEQIKARVMYECLLSKFQPGTNEGYLLEATVFMYLEETNYWGDQYWGVDSGKGLNMLGKLLMCVRDEEDPGLLIL